MFVVVPLKYPICAEVIVETATLPLPSLTNARDAVKLLAVIVVAPQLW